MDHTFFQNDYTVFTNLLLYVALRFDTSFDACMHAWLAELI